jgi:hypothetical protein
MENDGRRVVPVRGDVRWKLKAGDFTSYRWEITDIEYIILTAG